MTYNVFGGTLYLIQSINPAHVVSLTMWLPSLVSLHVARWTIQQWRCSSLTRQRWSAAFSPGSGCDIACHNIRRSFTSKFIIFRLSS